MANDSEVIASIELKEILRAQALAFGFDVAGFAAALPPPRAEALTPWLQAGAHGGMAWLAREPEKRQDPRRLMDGVATVMVLGVSSCPEAGEGGVSPAGCGTIAVHARRPDYHAVLKGRLQRLRAWLQGYVGREVPCRLFVDTAPLLEKPLGVAAGLGWQGKNSLLVSPRMGCWLLLAELFLPFALPPDMPLPDHCGRCRRCLQACPTDALAQPYRLQARRCLAYLTIEWDGPLAPADRIAMGSRLYGCDDCLVVCPWNRFAVPNRDVAWRAQAQWLAPALSACASLDDQAFRTWTHQMPMRRMGLVRWLRNVAVALGNWGAPEALPLLRQLLHHEAPLVRGHAAWGIGRILSQKNGMVGGSEPLLWLQAHRQQEADARVQEEIAAAVQAVAVAWR